MRIYNTMTRKKEVFVPLTPGEFKIYACGPTVYHYIHIGNARPACVFDVLRRYLEYAGYQVDFVQNFTDVDDKIINKANEEGVSTSEISERFIREYQKDAEGLNIRPATAHPKVTENMDIIIDFIRELIDSGHAYQADGDIYFQTESFAGYGKLSHMPLEDLQAGARIDSHEQKRDPMDFALWKAAKPGEPSWDSPWGKGRPGWHIECSAMAAHYLAPTIDLHCGGQDLIFPHHENEIAQSECANHVPFARYWMHNGYINIDNRKMSKSLGNFFTVREVAERYGYEPIRYLMLQAHYRSPINYNEEIIEQCQAALERLYTCRNNVDYALESAPAGTCTPEQQAAILEKKQQFIGAMEDDLNTADAISFLFELARHINTLTSGGALADKEHIEFARDVFDELCEVLGLLYCRKKEEVPQEVLDLAEQRQAARKVKDFATADRLRDQIAALGYLLEETRQGTRILKK